MPLVLGVTQLHEQLDSIASKKQTLAQARICLVDLRSAEAYAAGHIPGAVHANAALLNRSKPPVGGLMPTPEAVNLFLEQIGANLGDEIIAYDGGLETPAARLVWVLDAYGYEACSWLNGGYRSWLAKGLGISTDAVSVDKGTLELSFIGDNVISVDDMVEQLNNPQVSVLDVRTAGEFLGTDIRAAAGGHVPGAQHAEWTTLFNEHGQLHDDETLKALFGKLNVSDDKSVVVYCQSHQRSAVTYVVLKHLGFEDVRAIDGAWSAWGNRSDTPKQMP